MRILSIVFWALASILFATWVFLLPAEGSTITMTTTNAQGETTTITQAAPLPKPRILHRTETIHSTDTLTVPKTVTSFKTKLHTVTVPGPSHTVTVIHTETVNHTETVVRTETVRIPVSGNGSPQLPTTTNSKPGNGPPPCKPPPKC